VATVEELTQDLEFTQQLNYFTSTVYSFSARQEIPRFCDREGSLVCSRKPVTAPYTQPTE